MSDADDSVSIPGLDAARYRALIELSSDVYWELDAGLRLSWVAGRELAARRIDPQAFLGRVLSDLPGVVPEEMSWPAFLGLLEARETFRNVLLRHGPPGPQATYAVLSGEPWFGPDGRFAGYRGIGKDITARRALEARERAARDERNRALERLELLELLPEGVIVHDAGTIEYVNSALVRMTGVPDAAALIGRSLLALVAPEYHDAVLERVRLLQDGPLRSAAFSDRRLLRVDGGTLDVEMAAVVVGEGDAKRQQVIVRDISERKRQEAHILRVNAELEVRVAERTAALKAAIEEVEGITYTIAHDLKAPLRAIDGFSRLIEQSAAKVLTRETGGHFTRIRDNAGRMAALIDDLLDFAQLGRRALERAPVRLEDLVRDVAENLAPSWPRARVEVGALPAIEGDRALLWRVFANLIGNALKFSAQAAAPQVHVTASAGPAEVVVCVADNGVGFDMKHALKLFGVFQRLHAAREFEGTGIGLATVKRIVERHGGRVWAESAPGGGARFHLALPRQGPGGADSDLQDTADLAGGRSRA